MRPTHRLSSRLLLIGTATALAVGCTLITDVDRSKIPEPAPIAPDPLPDAGLEEEDAGALPPEPESTDAGPDGAAEVVPQDAGELTDAQADGG